MEIHCNNSDAITIDFNLEVICTHAATAPVNLTPFNPI